MTNIDENFSSDSLDVTQNELLSLLTIPHKNSTEWQSKAARLTAIEHNKSLSPEINDKSYFRSLALCRLAQNSGVTEAKKKNLQAVRFRSKESPALNALGCMELIIPAIELLSPLKGDWISAYITQEVVNPNLDKKGLISILKWAERAIETPAEIITVLLSRPLGDNNDEKRSLFLIKEAASKIRFSFGATPEVAAENLLSVVNVICRFVQDSQSKKVIQALISLLCIYFDKSRQLHPTIVIQGSFITSIVTMQERITQPLSKKLVIAIAVQQVPVVLSVLSDLIKFGGEEGSNYGRLIYPLLRQSLPNFDKVLDETSKFFPALKLIKASSEENQSLEDTATSIYARLLPAWYEFVRSYDNSSHLSAMNSDLLEAAALNGFELMGNPGDKVAFDPICHRLQRTDISQTEAVEIVRPAVIFRRSKSYRIVLPAIVQPV